MICVLRRAYLLFAFLVLAFSSNFGQTITLELNPGMSIPMDCQVFSEGQTIEFERGTSCDADVVIFKDGDPVPIFRTSELLFSFEFEDPGEYILFCGETTGPRPEVAISSSCFTVVEIVPTLSEWMVLILMLLMTITAVVSLKLIPALKYQN